MMSNSSTINQEFRAAIMPVTIIIGVEITLGLIGNSIVMWAYGSRYKTSTYRCFILYLGFIDILSCVITMPAEIYSEMFWFAYQYSFLCGIKCFFDIFTVIADVFAILIVAIERYKRMCISTDIQMSPLSARRYCYWITVTAILLASPGAMVNGLQHEVIIFAGGNVTVTMCQTSDHFKDTAFHLVYIVAILCFIGASLLSILFIYVVIVKELFKPVRSDDGEQSNILRSEPMEPGIRQQTVVLFAVSFVLSVTIMTYLVSAAYRLCRIQNFDIHETMIFALFFRLYFINHVINPFIYGWFDPRFRQLIRRSNTGDRKSSVINMYEGRPLDS